jgi:hypothetical protein
MHGNFLRADPAEQSASHVHALVSIEPRRPLQRPILAIAEGDGFRIGRMAARALEKPMLAPAVAAGKFATAVAAVGGTHSAGNAAPAGSSPPPAASEPSRAVSYARGNVYLLDELNFRVLELPVR